MTTFTDGPAKGQTLMLGRAPIFLRVVESGGKWDALDQPEDTPREHETVHVYLITKPAGHCHMSFLGAGGKRAGGFYAIADYALCPEQPDAAITRDNAKWAAWCHARVHLVNPELLKAKP